MIDDSTKPEDFEDVELRLDEDEEVSDISIDEVESEKLADSDFDLAIDADSTSGSDFNEIHVETDDDLDDVFGADDELDLFESESDFEESCGTDGFQNEDTTHLFKRRGSSMSSYPQRTEKLFFASFTALLIGAVAAAACGYVYFVTPTLEKHEQSTAALAEILDDTRSLLADTKRQLSESETIGAQFSDTLASVKEERKMLMAMIGISPDDDATRAAEVLRDELGREGPGLSKDERTYRNVIDHMKQAHREQLDELRRSIDGLKQTTKSTIAETRSSNESLSTQLKKFAKFEDRQRQSEIELKDRRHSLEESFLTSVRSEATEIVDKVFEKYDSKFQALFAEAEGITGLVTVATNLKTHATLSNAAASKKEAEIRLALVEKVDIDLRMTSLEHVVEHLGELRGIPMRIDIPALEDESVSLDQEVTLHVDDATLESALNRVLEPLELDWVIRDESILITSKTKAENLFTTVVYDISDLLSKPGQTFFDGSGMNYSPETLLEFIETTLGDENWGLHDDGGPTAQTFNGMLAVTQIQRVQKRVASLLSQLRKTGRWRDVQQSGGAAGDGGKASADESVVVTYRVAPALSNLTQTSTQDGNAGGLGLFPSTPPAPAAAPDPSGSSDSKQSAPELSDTLSKMIAQMVEPESWENSPDKAMIRSVPGAIIVKHSPAVHSQIRQLLQPFRPLSDLQPAHRPPNDVNRPGLGGGGFGGGGGFF